MSIRFITCGIAKHFRNYCKLMQVVGNGGTQITRYFVWINIVQKSIRVLGGLVILVGCKVKVMNELEVRECKNSLVG